MTATLVGLVIGWAGLVGVAVAEEKVLDVGKGEYDAACAICHGAGGRGDGAYTSQLKGQVPDLTVLAKNNQGVFPFDRVYQIIDGQQELKAHGSREMPIWGRAFR